MSGQQIGTVVGGIVGSFFGMPQLGMMLGGMVGGIIDPTVIKAPSIGDAQRQTTQAGVPRPVVYGHPAPFMGNIIDGEAKARKIIVTEGGKGGPEVEQEKFLLTSAIRICEGPIAGVVRVWRNGEVVYDVRATDDVLQLYLDNSESEILNLIGEARAKSTAFNGRFYLGTEDQLPDPALEALHGVGNTPYYRGTAYMVIEDDDVTMTRGAAAQWQFEVIGAGAETAVTESIPITQVWFENLYHETNSKAFYYDINSEFASVFLFANARSIGWGCRYRVFALYTPTVTRIENLSLFDSENLLGAIYDSGWWVQDESHKDGVRQMYIDAGLTAPAASEIRVGLPPDQYFSAPYPVQGLLLVTQFTQTGGEGHEIGIAEVRYPQSMGVDATLVPDAPGLFIGSDGKLYYPAWGEPGDLTTLSAAPVTLASVVADIAERCNVPAARIDAAALGTDIIPGFLVAQQYTGADSLRPTQQMFLYDLPEPDGKLKAVKRGGASVATIADDDLLEASEGDEEVRGQQVEFPLKVSVVTRDPAADYSPVPQTSVRTSANVVALGETVIQSPIPFGADEAMRRAEIIHKVLWAQAEGRGQCHLPEEWTRLVPSDPIEHGGKRWLVQRADYADGAVRLETVYDRASNYTSTATGVKPRPPVLPESGLKGATELAVMNLPPLREQDNVAGVYLAVTGAMSGWNGCTVQMSRDRGTTWSSVATITRRSTMGRLAADVGPTTEPIVVDLAYGELSDTTTDQLDLGANAFALVPDIGQSEIGQFAMVAENANGEQELTNTRRGVHGTDAVSYTAGEQFVMLANVVFLPVDSSLYGATLYFRAVTSGTDPDAAAVVPFLYLRPPALPDYRITESGDYRITEAGHRRILE